MTFEVIGGAMDGREIQLPDTLAANHIIYLLPQEMPLAVTTDDHLRPLPKLAFHNTKKKNQAGNVILIQT